MKIYQQIFNRTYVRDIICMVIKVKYIYLCIDLKTFYASVECVDRRLDPFKTDLVVADITRGKAPICLAISPKMKARGIKNRCRLFEIPKNIKPIIAKPRMKKYIEYSAKIYEIYLKYISKEDIHVYSIDEAFLDITSYLNLYHKSPSSLAKIIMNDIYNTTGITATAGIGTNLYLAKIALDIIAKHSKTNMGYLDEKLYQKHLWHHTPLTDFWQIGKGINDHLHKLHIRDMYDIAHTNENILYKEFGVNAKLLIDHAKGIEPCTIKDIKNYKPKTRSISNSQILFRNYNYKEARLVLVEMLDNLTQELVRKELYTNVIGIYIGYSDGGKCLKLSKKLHTATNSYTVILDILIREYDFCIDRERTIRRLGVWYGNLNNKKIEQLDIFNSYVEADKDNDVEQMINLIRNKYGNNTILRGVSYLDCSTQKIRNNLIGGHNAE